MLGESPESSELISTSGHVIGHVRSCDPSRTAAGRGRAWLRFGIMQKKLGEHFTVCDV